MRIAEETRNLKLFLFNQKPETRNLKLFLFNQKPETLPLQPSTFQPSKPL
jgi:hypothetical protein